MSHLVLIRSSDVERHVEHGHEVSHLVMPDGSLEAATDPDLLAAMGHAVLDAHRAVASC